jgi:hypothetical protein
LENLAYRRAHEGGRVSTTVIIVAVSDARASGVDFHRGGGREGENPDEEGGREPHDGGRK